MNEMNALANWVGTLPVTVLFSEWLKTTSVAKAMVTLPWLWPVCETLHFIGLTLLVGVVGMMDLRLLGFMREVPISAIKKMVPFAILGFVINATTGLMFYAGAPDQDRTNISWYLKLMFLAVAGLNMAFFELRLGRRAMALAPGLSTPVAFKVVGAVSLTCWLAVLYFGRMLPFLGDAF